MGKEVEIVGHQMQAPTLAKLCQDSQCRERLFSLNDALFFLGDHRMQGLRSHSGIELLSIPSMIKTGFYYRYSTNCEKRSIALLNRLFISTQRDEFAHSH